MQKKRRKARRIAAAFLAVCLAMPVFIQTEPVKAATEVSIGKGTEYDTVGEINTLIRESASDTIFKLISDLDFSGVNARITFEKVGNYTLDLNGYTITGGGTDNSVILVSKAGTVLTLTDSGKNKDYATTKVNYKVVGEDTTEENRTYVGGGITIPEGDTINHLIYVKDGAVFNMEGGAIYGGNTDGTGGAIEVFDSTINLYSGVIANNKANQFGGGICLMGSDLTIGGIDGKDPVIISGNTATSRGGGIYAFNGTGIYAESEIQDQYGNVVANTDGRKGNEQYKSTITIEEDSDCYITDNHVYTEGGEHLDNGGGGIRIDDDGEFVMNSGNITGNTSGAGGGGLMAGYYNTTGWKSGDYEYIAEVDRVSVIINGGSISANKSNREGAGVFIGGNCSGNVTGLFDTYIKNNEVADDTTDWGGAGLFVGAASSAAEIPLLEAGLDDYIGPGSLHVQKAVIKDNTALGFGGGVAGCATARVFINVDQIATEKDVEDGIATAIGEVLNRNETIQHGVAIYDNVAMAEHDENYFPLVKEGDKTDHLSGTTSAKNEDRVYTNGNEVFWDNDFQDYFCALNTQIGNYMLGGGTEDWKGSADSVYVERGDSYTASDENIYASYLTGLTENASEASKDAAEDIATVEISGNISGTHGGGILANGVLVLGDIPTGALEVQDRIVINATKLVESVSGETITHPATGFKFDVFQYDGLGTAVRNSITDTDNDSQLGKLNMTFAYNGESSREPWAEYTYFIAERGNADGDYSADRTVYYVSIMGTRTKEPAGDTFNVENEDGEIVGTEMDIATITRVRILKRTLSPDEISYDENGNPTLLVPLAVGSNPILGEGLDQEVEEDAAKIAEINDKLWRDWQKSYEAHVDEDGNFVSTYHGNKGERTDDVRTINNDHVTVVVDYEIDENGQVIKSEFANPEVGTTVDVKDVIDLKKGTDHAKTLNLDLALGTETFVNVENKTSVTVTKEWTGITGTEKPPVTLELYQSTKAENDAEATVPFRTIILDGIPDDVETTAWVAEFKDLPNTSPLGYEYKYWVKEAAAATGSMPYNPVYANGKYALDGEKITNAFVQEYVTVNVTKNWDDGANNDNSRPTSITVILYRNGQEVERKTVSDNNGTWACTFTNLDKYNNSGKAYTYTVGEETVTGYTANIVKGTSTDDEVNYTITNSKAADTTSVTVTKKWNDGDGSNRPASVEVTLLIDGVESTDAAHTATLNAANNWSYIFTGLAVNDNGEAIDYSVREKAVAGYISGEPLERGNNNFVIINTETTSVKVTKKWVGADGKETAAPNNAEITFTLYKDGVADKTITLNGKTDTNGESGEWTATFTDLPKYRDDNNEIVYTVKETEGHVGYVNSTENGFVSNGGVITNTQIGTSVTVSKKWSNADGSTAAPKGSSVTFTIYDKANQSKAVKSITLNGAANHEGEGQPWVATFTGLPMYNEDNETIEYIVKETAGYAGYDTSYGEGMAYAVGGGVITNKQKEVEITVSKAWKDADGNSIQAPDGATATFTLYEGNSATIRYIVLDGTPDNNGEYTAWTATFKNLPQYQENGQTTLYYAVQETGIWEGYTPDKNFAHNGEVITNERVVVEETTYGKITINKKNKEGAVLSGAEFTLYDGETVIGTPYVTGDDGTVVISTEDEAVKAILPAAGESKELSLKETKAPDGYKTDDTVWEVIIETTFTTDETVLENAVKRTAYSIKVSGAETLTVVNEKITSVTPDPEDKTDLIITVKWDDGDNVDKTRPDKDVYADKIHPTKDGQKIDGIVPEITDNEDGTYTVTYEDLPKYDEDGEKIDYGATQDTIDKYDTEIEKVSEGRITITNIYKPSVTPDTDPEETTDLTVTIEWDDVDNVDETRPGKEPYEDYIYLTKDGEKVEDSNPYIKDNGDGTFTITFEGLPKYDGDREIIYSLEQSDIYKYSTTTRTDETGHLIITNVYRPSTPAKPPVDTSDSTDVFRYIWLCCGTFAIVMIVTLNRKSQRAY